MPNAIKYNVSAETLALKKGNFWIGTGDVGKGPTSSTGFYNGITPPSGGYTIYLNKETGGPSIYTVTTEAQMVSLTNTIGAQSFTTSGQCLNWFATQTDKMIFNIDYPAIVTNGLVLNLDAGFTPSYPTTATTWYDSSSNGNNGALTNGPTYSSVNGGGIVFDGVDDRILLSYNPIYKLFSADTVNQTWTISMWVNLQTKSSGSQSITQYYNNIGPGLYLVFPYNNNLPLMWTDGQYFLYGNTIIVDKGPTNVVFQFDGNSARKIWNIYLNGKLDATRTLTISNANFPLLYANQTISSSGEEIKGNMYTYSVYDRVLSSTEINQNYYAMLNTRMIVTNGLVLNLQAGNPNSYTPGSNMWNDMSGYGNNFTLVNNPTFNTSNGGYLQFDGADDYAYLAVNSSISVGTSCSLEMVVKNDYSMRMGQGGGYWSYGFEGVGFSHTCGGNGNISPYFIGNGFHHYVFTWNQAQNNHSMYRDGTLVYSFTPTCGFNAGGGGYFVLGGAYAPNSIPAPGFQSYGSPHIATLRLYNRILTEAEVTQNSNLMKTQFGI
jgi:hypothetical protein